MPETEKIKDEIARSAPPVGISALSLFGLNLADWVYILTIIYLIVQIAYLLYKIYRHCKLK